MNSIERLQIGSDQEWRIVSLNEKMAKTDHLCAVSFEDKIVVFGGTIAASYSSYILSEKGELLKDQSKEALIPEDSGSFTVKDNKIWTVARRTQDDEWKWRVESFDGKKWQLI